MFRRDLPSKDHHGGWLVRVGEHHGIAPAGEQEVLQHVDKWPDSAQPLGFWNDRPVAVVQERGEPQWPSAREWLARLPESRFPLISTALQVVAWQRDHRFCGRCGQASERVNGEFAMQCPACGHRNYPRISPCIITLVTCGKDLLLARSPRFPPGRYSTLAGFIEPGETAEDAVRREVHEEVGLTLGEVTYYRSQAWPFPHSLMLGFFAEATSRRIRIDGTEIVDAAWYTPHRLPQLPPPYSIARALIEAHLRAVGADRD
ncbi:NAD+ diphosphatase [Modicisalibacter ilicicola DSM 19980]|uniref:NAD(+) diphosphatase n=1 Tax=Modicisalibacter ilicicola DSM 19980 TaxID=1121942 RepID=A0A1M5E2D1_9GAMM|nr:NAD(+) diphosphatase [Halomonas ilicicola]SHF73418.1 NAD+ diphosphatase [Halomonas ilicicola DSM 19980]